MDSREELADTLVAVLALLIPLVVLVLYQSFVAEPPTPPAEAVSEPAETPIAPAAEPDAKKQAPVPRPEASGPRPKFPVNPRPAAPRSRVCHAPPRGMDPAQAAA